MGNKVNLMPYRASDLGCRMRDGQQGRYGDGSCCWERVGVRECRWAQWGGVLSAAAKGEKWE